MHSDVAEEHAAAIFRVIELIQVDAEFSYCEVGGSVLQFCSHHLSIDCCENPGNL